ncbi:MAG: glutaredoxin domain-containing protein, partial [Gammaproteobacteria bacterium]
LVRDGVIEKMFIEPQEDGDPFHVSDADTMFDYVAPGGERPLDVAVLSRPGCSYCARAKQRLAQHGIEYAELELHKDFPHRVIRAVSGVDTLPQIFVDGELIGGADELDAWLAQRAAA